jgi:hypothetical protein
VQESLKQCDALHNKFGTWKQTRQIGTPSCQYAFFFILDCEAIGTAATPGLLCQPRVIMKMIVEK